MDPNTLCVSKKRALSSSCRVRKIPQYDGPADEIDSHNDARDEARSQDTATTLTISDLFDGRTPEQLEKSVENGLELLKAIKGILGEHKGQEVSRWIEAIDNVESQAVRSRTVIGVVGATGAGKSSVINAVLDEERLVPTSCMRACTAVVTEISYNHQDGAPYRAEVEFISKDDWRKMLNVLLQDLRDRSGQQTNEDSETAVAYAQVKAVYPGLTREDMDKTHIETLMAHKNVARLGTKHNIESSNAITFYKELQPFVDSKKKTSGPKERTEKEKKQTEAEYWPLIRVVKLYVKAPALATGAVIVDLPGVHDSNHARAAVSQDYMKQCTGLLIVAPITRAVDDKSAKTLLGDSFKRQLKMDGGLSSVTFICSRTDEISMTEAQDSLGLEEELAPMLAELGDLSTKKDSINNEIADLEHSKSSIDADIDIADEGIEVWDKLQAQLEEGKIVTRPEAGSLKRNLSDTNSHASKRPKLSDPGTDHDRSFRDNGCARQNGFDYGSSNTSHGQGQPLTEEDISNKLAELESTSRGLRGKMRKIHRQIQELRARDREIDKEHESISAKLSARCIEGRNEYSRTAIRQDYAAGIRELDQELAEEEDAANFDPGVDARDYDEVARNLPVFCVSSRAYQKLKGRLKKDKTPAGFQHEDETEIPALQAHCVQLTATARQASSRKFLTSMFQLLNSLRLWISNDTATKSVAETQLEQEAQILEERLHSLDSALEKACDEVVDEFSKELRDKVYDVYPHATRAARDRADNTVHKWGSPVNWDDPAAGGLHWSTYKAVVRRDGCFTNARGCHNFNQQLLEPLIRQLSRPWETVFTRRLAIILKKLPPSVTHTITAFHNDVERRAIRNGISVAFFKILKQQIPLYQETLNVAINDARSWVTTEQRSISREFEPLIAGYMHDVYSACANEFGLGSYRRMRDQMEQFVEDEKMSMFDNVVDDVNELIEQMLKGLKVALLASLGGVFKDVEREYTSVVIHRDFGNEDRQTMRDKVLKIVDSAELVFKRAVGIESEYGTAPESEMQRQPDNAETSVAIKMEPREDISVRDYEKET
ncbi:uncharacterized protein PV07_01112 [Cladophialophora immunda]|uniref:G domain-containing protein n=1 Tax=Cladophialophora immunda TaxID=569365 RepID=A0A0D2B9P9_9EURO|nr:uncharacterized protein PV07_01112 [Cladophialophora immunda]KIW34327.1 hypothetical protein PV07_01112 [Cladophialophora immunda]